MAEVIITSSNQMGPTSSPSTVKQVTLSEMAQVMPMIWIFNKKPSRNYIFY